MRRVMRLVLLLLALPTAALASSIFFFTVSSSPEQEQQSGWSAGGTGFPITALAVGPKYTISVVTGPATITGQLFSFTGGTLDVRKTSTGASVFQNSVVGGSGSIPIGADEIFVGGTLVPNARINFGTFSFQVFNSALGATATVFATTPEPSTLLSFGTGVVVLAEMVRRKFKRGI